MDALLICVPVARTVGREKGGDFCLDAEGRISRSGDYVYGGAQVIAFRFEIPGWEARETESAVGFTIYGHACASRSAADHAELLFDDR